ncbi:mCG148019 [Mus musculus]|nr:mCG148019 [Mus musculus]
MEDSLLTTCMYWSALHFVVELHLSGLHREEQTKKFLVMCYSFLLLPRIRAHWQSDVS